MCNQGKADPSRIDSGGSRELLKARLNKAPPSPGVYLFKDQEGRIIYIGKAKSLRQRIRSYFQSSRGLDLKTDYINRNAADLEFIVTDSEVEALILESTLVKKNQPTLNVRLKDDKAFLHIKLTVNEDFPRVLLTRRIRNDGALYFGPYLPASLARNTIKIINRHFQLRTCSIDIDGSLERPCLEYYIKRCLGPCVKGLCSKDGYSQAVEDVIMLLEGKNEQLIEQLSRKMLEASEKEQFEAAAFFRDRIQLVKDLAEKQKMMVTGGDDVDLFGYYKEGSQVALQLFSMRGGRIVGKREFFWEALDFFEPARFIQGALQQYYLQAVSVPTQIYIPVSVDDQDLIEEWLTEKLADPHRKRVRLHVPMRGEKLDLLMLVERNAKIAFESRFKIKAKGREGLLQELTEELGLPKIPVTIEAFDISNIQGSEPVASMVVCKDGVMDRSQYRKFKIKTVKKADDFAAMREVVYRRYKRLLSEEKDLPELILVDGGKGQLHSAYQALADLGIEDTPLISIAKREELIFVQGEAEPIYLERNSRTLHLIQEVRDEAHRFAVSYHRKRRNIRDFHSKLDDIPGVGRKRKRRLLQNFGSVRRIAQASEDELVPFVGAKLAREVKKFLAEAAPEREDPE